MSTALRELVERIDRWRWERRPEKREKERALAGVLRAWTAAPQPPPRDRCIEPRGHGTSQSL